ncbi:hypothetical protein [Chitinilyticum aquatile]|uniref:hypothetical protein n=1 Tax=Chitinilyticum aquatile TaxID=362520 RepID=UPI00138AD234|nr:hypothetical protein [Chitinilyticum aquatile]
MPDNPYQTPAANLAMPDDPYQAPAVDLTAPPEPRQPGALWKAVLFGVLIDTGGTLAFVTLLALGLGIALSVAGLPPAQLEGEIQRLQQPFSGFWLTSIAVGLGFSLLGGYVCARIAHRPSLRPVYVLAACSFVFGALLGGLTNGWILFLLLSASGIASNLLGGWLYQRHHWPARQYQPPHTSKALD